MSNTWTVGATAMAVMISACSDEVVHLDRTGAGGSTSTAVTSQTASSNVVVSSSTQTASSTATSSSSGMTRGCAQEPTPEACVECVCAEESDGCDVYQDLVFDHLYCGLTCGADCADYCSDPIANPPSVACYDCIDGFTGSRPDFYTLLNACTADPNCSAYLVALQGCYPDPP
jgi:hypothetical protein